MLLFDYNTLCATVWNNYILTLQLLRQVGQ